MKKKFSGWDLKFYWDDIFFAFANLGFRMRYLLKGGAKRYGLRKNIELKDKHKGQRAFIIGNGPSIVKHDLKLLRGEVTFFVNRAFLHEDYAFIKPTYHIFVDPKMVTGEWPLSFLDEVVGKNPDGTFLLNAKWHTLPQFHKYNNKYTIYWLCQTLFFQPYFSSDIDLTTIGVGGAVVEQGVLAAVYMGIKDIFFLGVDGNGLCYELTRQDSHFYGENPENRNKKFRDIYRDLALMSNSLRRWELIGRYCDQKGVNLINLTGGGIMDFCQRMKYEDVLNS